MSRDPTVDEQLQPLTVGEDRGFFPGPLAFVARSRSIDSDQ